MSCLQSHSSILLVVHFLLSAGGRLESGFICFERKIICSPAKVSIYAAASCHTRFRACLCMLCVVEVYVVYGCDFSIPSTFQVAANPRSLIYLI